MSFIAMFIALMTGQTQSRCLVFIAQWVCGQLMRAIQTEYSHMAVDGLLMWTDRDLRDADDLLCKSNIDVSNAIWLRAQEISGRHPRLQRTIRQGARRTPTFEAIASRTDALARRLACVEQAAQRLAARWLRESHAATPWPASRRQIRAIASPTQVGEVDGARQRVRRRGSAFAQATGPPLAA